MVARLFAPQLLLLYWLTASMLAVHFRGRVRLGFFRQLTDHSTILSPYNTLMYLFSAVPNRPFIPTARFPELAKLRDNWQTIRTEALQLFDDGHIKVAEKYNDMGFNSFFRTGWKRFYLKWYDDPLPSAERLCPKTVELLKTIPNIKGAMFATLSPGSRLVTHRDPYAGSLRYHLGLVTCLLVDDKFELVRRLHWKLLWSCAAKDAINVGSHLPVRVCRIGSIRNQTPADGKIAKGIDGRQLMSGRVCNDQVAMN